MSARTFEPYPGVVLPAHEEGITISHKWDRREGRELWLITWRPSWNGARIECEGDTFGDVLAAVGIRECSLPFPPEVLSYFHLSQRYKDAPWNLDFGCPRVDVIADTIAGLAAKLALTRRA